MVGRTVFIGLFFISIAGAFLLSSVPAEARYTGSGPACVTNVAAYDRLNVRTHPRADSQVKGSLDPNDCAFGIEAVEGQWTYIRGSDRGRNIEGWVNNWFLRAKDSGGDQGGGDQGDVRASFPLPAATGGGNVRRGPGTNYRRVASLREFEKITVIRNTGVMFNGYPWFEIRFRGGRKGFQWGGIICSTDTPFEGTFDTCENFRRSLSGNTSGGSSPSERRVAFDCNEGIPLIVTFIQKGNEDYALYSHDSGPKIRVAAQPSGSGYRYTNGYHELRGKGNAVDLIEGGDVIDSCRAR